MKCTVNWHAASSICACTSVACNVTVCYSGADGILLGGAAHANPESSSLCRMIRIHSGAIPGCAALSGSDYSCRRAHMLVCCACAWLRLLAIRLVNMMRYVSKKIGQIGDKLQVKLKSGSCQQLITGFTSSLKSFYAARGRKPQFFDTARFSSCPPPPSACFSESSAN